MPHRHRSIALFSMSVLVLVAGELWAQQPTLTAKDVMGTYASGTHHVFAPGIDACWLEVAPSAVDSVRLQLLCRNPAPGHHLGVLDVRRRFDAGTVVSKTDEFLVIVGSLSASRAAARSSLTTPEGRVEIARAASGHTST
jgi:hypothetical protein